jgi:NAD(P)-dependent dehydrogenase (short-subunit alcohol dehydrogenase family)
MRRNTGLIVCKGGVKMNKVVVITGAAGGIGQAICNVFADDVVCALDSKAGAGHLVDITCISDVELTVKNIIDLHRRIDVLVNCAGITKDGYLTKQSSLDWHEVIDVNLTGSRNMIKAVVPHMMKQESGKIINISSVNANGCAGQTNYSASKAALEGLTKACAYEFAKYNILVNAVAPGYVRTAMTEKIRPEKLKNIIDTIPLWRMAEPIEIAYMVEFLASNKANYITGQVFGVNGGLRI